MKRITLILFMIMVTTSPAFSQTGDSAFRRMGIMDGNNILTLFFNYGQIGTFPPYQSCEWPKGSGHGYSNGIAVWVAAEAVDVHGDTIHPVETQYREFMDLSPEYKPWGWEPLPGYFNPNQDSPAMSDDPNTWPDYWHDKTDDQTDPGWTGKWNGFFGKGIIKADLETYFVMDDDADEEWDFYPDSTDLSRRGLGLQVAVRGFQWSTPSAEDIIFWHYEITNESTTNYEKLVCGTFIDFAVGGDGDHGDDCGRYDLDFDFAYAWDFDNSGGTGWGPVGFMGYVWLESPGNPYDGIDNDNDGMTDERRDDGIDNDGDWNSVTDDVGYDGVANTGDFGEGDGIPNNGEPNFDRTDKDESDQIGLTCFRPLAMHALYFRNDEQVWDHMAYVIVDTSSFIRGNLCMFFASGPFPLFAKHTERFSFALLFGENFDELVAKASSARSFYNNDYQIPTKVVDTSNKNLLKQQYRLSQNYPNPFNVNTKIEYSLSQNTFVKIIIYNSLGQKVKTLINRLQSIGDYSVEWDGTDENNNQLSSGLYFYQLVTDNQIKHNRMLLLK